MKLRANRIDLATALGILTAATLVVIAIVLSGTPHAFVDLPALVIVIGGTFAVTTACFTIPEVYRAQKLILQTVFYRRHFVTNAAEHILGIADRARKNSILALENYVASDKATNFLRSGLSMVVDGAAPDKIEALLRRDIHSLMERHHRGVAVLRKAAEISPAMGLIGTLIGLIQMLAHLDDPSNIGPAMAVALLTTLYGALLSYMVFTPLAAKLERNTNEEVLVNQIYMEGILSIARKENPRQLEVVMNTMLPPSNQVHFFDEEPGEKKSKRS